MRITQVASYFPPPYGGIESHVFYLSRQLVEMGHEVTVLTSRSMETGAEKEEVRDGVLVKRLWTPLSFFNFPFMPTLLYKVLREETDIFHGHINSPMVVERATIGSWLRGIPLVITYHADIVPEDVGLENLALARSLSWLYENLFKRLDAKVASRIVATTSTYAESSEFLADYLNKVCVVPNGVDLDRFKPGLDVSGVRERLGLKDERIIFFAGRLVPYKGLGYLLEAFSALCKKRTDLRLVLLGTGSLIGDLRRRVRMMHLDELVRFVASVSEEELPRFYAASDVVVMPSRSRSEGFCISALQGMACGKPIVATRVGGVPFLVRDGETGILVEPKDWRQLFAAISRILENPALAARMGRAGRRRAERFFSWSRVAEMIERIYEEILQQG